MNSLIGCKTITTKYAYGIKVCKSQKSNKVRLCLEEVFGTFAFMSRGSDLGSHFLEPQYLLYKLFLERFQCKVVKTNYSGTQKNENGIHARYYPCPWVNPEHCKFIKRNAFEKTNKQTNLQQVIIYLY